MYMEFLFRPKLFKFYFQKSPHMKKGKTNSIEKYYLTLCDSFCFNNSLFIFNFSKILSILSEILRLS